MKIKLDKNGWYEVVEGLAMVSFIAGDWGLGRDEKIYSELAKKIREQMDFADDQD